MATEDQKKERQTRLFNDIIAGFAKGLYDLFGDSALAMVATLGDKIIGEMEQELGLEISGESAQDILTEMSRLLVDEYGISDEIDTIITDDDIAITVTNCRLWRTSASLEKNDVPPYICVPMMMASASLRERLGMKSKFTGIEQDKDKHICKIAFKMF